ncbi:hypothetical protein QCA50_009176 [Cerrena zonata]|uniref:alkaline phosphatase n=1 Tax=Cerrena zonata TaxID=2478898 RepID=A0AAW0GDF2_9APHY
MAILSTMMKRSSILLLLPAVLVSAQTFQRLGTCPTLGCVIPPDQTDFLAGQHFDIRLEVHAPVNGSEAFNEGVPDDAFTFCIEKVGSKKGCVDAAKFFGVKEPALEKWTFDYFEDLFAQDAGSASVVNVASKAFRGLSLREPGEYLAKLSYYGGMQTVAHWAVPKPVTKRTAKNVIFFIGDGMTQNMITAARLIGHKSINGRYQTLMQMDQMEVLGHQMTHSIDSFITDSANSASALMSGKKCSSGSLNVWGDSTPTPFDDPKMETIAELFKRKRGGPIGMVSTAQIADATPASLCAHTRDRGTYAANVFEYLHSPQDLNSTLAWPTGCGGVDVIFGGGAEQFVAGKGSWEGKDFYQEFAKAGYNVVQNKTQLEGLSGSKKALGIFTVSHLSKWLDRHVYTNNLSGQKNSPTGDGSDATDQPGLKDMTLKAIEILHAQAKKNNTGFFLMSEAASIDKMMHVLDYDRALGELLELDDTIRATIQYLKEIGEEDDTLIVVTADHGHGFDVFGGADTKYLAEQDTDRAKRRAVGIYEQSGLSGYQVVSGSLPNNNTVVFGDQGPNFPVTWNPRYAFAAGFGGTPDHREGYVVNSGGIRQPTAEEEDGFVANPNDQPNGFHASGTLPPSSGQGVHSLTDVSVFANGPGSDAFRGVYNNVDIFFKIANALGLAGGD